MSVALQPLPRAEEPPVRDSKEALKCRLARAEGALTVTLETILRLRVELQNAESEPTA